MTNRSGRKPSDNRAGKRRDRNQRVGARVPESQYRIPWIIFDRDQVKDFDNIIRKAEKNDVGAGWSNPCFEIWMYAYFDEMPAIKESYICCDRFAETFKKITNDNLE